MISYKGYREDKFRQLVTRDPSVTIVASNQRWEWSAPYRSIHSYLAPTWILVITRDLVKVLLKGSTRRDYLTELDLVHKIERWV